MEARDFNAIRRIVYEQAGIALSEHKQALVASRLAKRMRQLGIQRHADYVHHLEHDRSGEELVQLLDVISTNVTSFFREPQHFEALRQYLDRLIANGCRKLRLWSAAASTGEEPYTLAMLVSEATRGHQVDARILATDISTRVLAWCKRGIYPGKRVEPVSNELRRRYFIERTGDDGTEYEVVPELKRLVAFQRLNLSRPPFPMRGPLQAVFCRNVMIYFDNPVRTRLLQDVHRLLADDGMLVVGATESLVNLDVPFRAVAPSIYRKR